MKRNLISIFLIFTFTGCITTSRQYIPKSHFAASPPKIDVKEYENKYKKYKGVYIYHERSMKHVYKSIYFSNPLFSNIRTKWFYYDSYRSKYIVFNQDAKELTTFILFVPANTLLVNLSLRVTYPNHKSVTYKYEDLNVEVDSYGNHLYKFSYPNISKGTIIEENYEIRYDSFVVIPPLKYDIDLQLTIPCEEMVVNFTYPKEWEIQVKKIDLQNRLNYKIDSDVKGNKTLTYREKNILAFKRGEFSPDYKDYAPYLEFQISKIGMSPICLTDWSKFVRNVRLSYMCSDKYYFSKIKRTTRKLLKNSNSATEKFNKIISMIKNDIEINKGNYSLENTMKYKKGNAASITSLTYYMLYYAGFYPEYILIRPSEKGYFDKKFISYDQFVIPAIRVKVNNSTFISIPYIKNLPPNLFPSSYVDQNAIVIRGKGINNIISIPSNDSKLNTIKEVFDIKINDSGIIHVKEKKIINGLFAFYHRNYLLNVIKEHERKEFIKEMLTYSDGDIKLIYYRIENANNCNKPFIVDIEYEINNLITITDDEILFQTSGLFSPVSIQRYKMDTEERENPIKIFNDESFVKNITLEFPKKWKIQNRFENVNLENQFGYNKGLYKMESGLLSVAQIKCHKKCFVPKENLGEFLKLSGGLSKLEIPTIIFDTKK